MKTMRARTHFNTYLLILLLAVSAVFAEDTTGGSASGETSTTTSPAATTEPAPTAPTETATSAPEPTSTTTTASDTTSSATTPTDTTQPPVSSDSITSETTQVNTDPLAPANPEGLQPIVSTNPANSPVPAPQEFQNPPPPPPTDAIFNQVPPNCKKITDDNGIERVICDTQCPNPPPESDMQKCRDNRGIPQFFADSRGCNIFECKYQESGNFGANRQCPSEEERSRVSEQCKQSGMRSVMRNDFNGCLMVDCVQEGRKNEMQCPPNEEDKRIADNCKQNGGRIVPGFDPRGCKISLCEYNGNIPGAIKGPDSDRYIRDNECREIPKEAFEKCAMDGGELVVKRDKSGCPTFTECVMRGNERNLQYEEVSEVPDSSVLLSMAFKLENLKIEFDKLSKKTDAIAAYYDSTGKTADAERFRKASSMFVGAETRIDEIKSKMKSRVDSMTTNDISEIKHDIKYIREVVMKDILYVMLGGDESGERTATTGALSMEQGRKSAVKPSKNSEGVVDCGTDGFCFNEQLRVCEKAIFYPPSDMGGKTVMRIEGLDDGKCILNAEVIDGSGTGIADMKCKFPDYVMGMKSPEELIPYCEGSMADGFKKYNRVSKPRVPKTMNNNYQEEMPFGERPDGVASIENTEYNRPMQPLPPNQPMQPLQPNQPIEPIIVRQTGQEFPEEIAPIGYLLKQFAII